MVFNIHYFNHICLAHVNEYDGMIILIDKLKKEKPDFEAIRRKLGIHVEKLRQIRERREPRLGELAEAYLEEEFEE